MSRIRNNSGSALLWTVLVLGVLTILSTAVLTISMAYSKRNLTQGHDQQAYFTALSAVDLVAAQFSGTHPENSNQQKIVERLEKGEVIVIDDMELPSELGTCTVTMTMEGTNQIVITADAQKSGSSYRLSAILKGDVIITNPETPSYGGEGTPGVGAGGITGGAGLVTDPNTDIYIWNHEPFILDSRSSSGDTLHMGALYTNGPVELRCNKWNYSHLHGEIIGTDNITFFDNATAGLLPHELLPDGRTQCCDNHDPSFIHTTGQVTMTGKSRMGGDITANSIVVQEGARVAGNLTANDIRVEGNSWEGSDDPDYYMVKGDLRANTVTLSQGAIVIGNITAQTVRMTGSPYVAGSITAQNIIMETTNATDPATQVVEGSVTANSLTMSKNAKMAGDVTADTLSMKDGSKINGNVLADKISIDTYSSQSIFGNLSYYQSPNDINAVLRKKVTGTVTRLAAAPPVATGPEKLPPISSQLPPKPQQPPIPPIPTSPKPTKIDRGGYVTVGNETAESYYVIAKNSIMIHELTVVGNHNIYIYLPANYEVTVRSMRDDTPPPPNVFFILGNDSELELKGDNSSHTEEFPIYVWSPEGSGAELELDRNTTIFGGVWVDKIESGLDCEFHWVPPNLTFPTPDPDPDPNPNPDPDPDPEDTTIKWGLAGYRGN